MRLFLYNVSRMKIVTKLIGLLSVFNAVLWTGAGSLLLWWLYVPLRLDLFGEGDIRWLHAVMVLLAMAIIVAITVRFWIRAIVFVRSGNVQDASSANRLRFAVSVLCAILWSLVTVMACLGFSSWVVQDVMRIVRNPCRDIRWELGFIMSYLTPPFTALYYILISWVIRRRGFN